MALKKPQLFCCVFGITVQLEHKNETQEQPELKHAKGYKYSPI